MGRTTRAWALKVDYDRLIWLTTARFGAIMYIQTKQKGKHYAIRYYYSCNDLDRMADAGDMVGVDEYSCSLHENY